MLGKAIAPLTTQQASENGDFYLQNYHNYQIFNFSFCPHVDQQHPPLSKKEQTTTIEHVGTIRTHPGGFCQPQIVVWDRGAHHIASERQVTVQVYSSVHSGFVSRFWFE